MTHTLRPRVVLLTGAFLMVVNGALMTFWNRFLHMPLSQAVTGYIVITPLLLIGLFAGFARLDLRRSGKSKMQKVVFLLFFPASGIWVFAGFYMGYQLATCILWYIGMLVVFTYYFLGFK